MCAVFFSFLCEKISTVLASACWRHGMDRYVLWPPFLATLQRARHFVSPWYHNKLGSRKAEKQEKLYRVPSNQITARYIYDFLILDD